MKPLSHIARLLLAIVAFMVIDGHLAVTQLYAWATMIADRTEERGFTSAVESTFSGAEPCEHCMRVIEERQQEHERSFILEKDPLHKLITSAREEISLKTPAACYLAFNEISVDPYLSLSITPPTPPPDSFIL